MLIRKVHHVAYRCIDARQRTSVAHRHRHRRPGARPRGRGRDRDRRHEHADGRCAGRVPRAARRDLAGSARRQRQARRAGEGAAAPGPGRACTALPHRRLHRLLHRHPPRHRGRQAVPPGPAADAQLQVGADRLPRARLLDRRERPALQAPARPAKGRCASRAAEPRRPPTGPRPSSSPTTRSTAATFSRAIYSAPGRSRVLLPTKLARCSRSRLAASSRSR